MGKLVGCAGAVLRARFFHRAADAAPFLSVKLAFELVEGFVHVEMCMPHVQVAQFGKMRHSMAVLLRAGAHGITPLVFGEAAVASADFDACCQALDVPFPRSGGGLVEVVDVEDKMTRRAQEDAEVRNVGVAYALDLKAGRRLRSKVVRHDDGGPAIEGERRSAHALVAQRNELGHAGGGLLFEQRDDVLAIRRGVPVRQGCEGACRARFDTALLALGDGSLAAASELVAACFIESALDVRVHVGWRGALGVSCRVDRGRRRALQGCLLLVHGTPLRLDAKVE